MCNDSSPDALHSSSRSITSAQTSSSSHPYPLVVKLIQAQSCLRHIHCSLKSTLEDDCFCARISKSIDHLCCENTTSYQRQCQQQKILFLKLYMCWYPLNIFVARHGKQLALPFHQQNRSSFLLIGHS